MTAIGNRNDFLAQFASSITNGSLTYQEIEAAVLEKNSTLHQPLSEEEVQKTILHRIKTGMATAA